MSKKMYMVGEIKLRYQQKKMLNIPKVVSSQESFNVAMEFFSEDILPIQEQFIVIYLNNANELLGYYCMSIGGLTGTVADIRLILAVALQTVCTQIVVAHNHPSGNIQPSMTDKELTRKLKESAALMDIKLIDHIIVSPHGQYFSFADEGHL